MKKKARTITVRPGETVSLRTLTGIPAGTTYELVHCDNTIVKLATGDSFEGECPSCGTKLTASLTRE